MYLRKCAYVHVCVFVCVCVAVCVAVLSRERSKTNYDAEMLNLLSWLTSSILQKVIGGTEEQSGTTLHVDCRLTGSACEHRDKLERTGRVSSDAAIDTIVATLPVPSEIRAYHLGHLFLSNFLFKSYNLTTVSHVQIS